MSAIHYCKVKVREVREVTVTAWGFDEESVLRAAKEQAEPILSSEDGIVELEIVSTELLSGDRP